EQLTLQATTAAGQRLRAPERDLAPSEALEVPRPDQRPLDAGRGHLEYVAPAQLGASVEDRLQFARHARAIFERDALHRLRTGAVDPDPEDRPGPRAGSLQLDEFVAQFLDPTFQLLLEL